MPFSKVSWVSRIRFDGLRPDGNAAAIVIADPGAARAVGKGWGMFLSLAFSDLDDDGLPGMQRRAADWLGRWPDVCASLGKDLFGGSGEPWRPFLSADAGEVAAFVRRASANPAIGRLVVCCRSGKSRSRAVAEAAADFLAVAAQGDLSGTANARVVRLLAASFVRAASNRKREM